jgi:homoserine/homoserine lactone efflux protein
MSLDTWIALFLACWFISLSPGAGAIASMSSGLNHGFRTGYWNAIGLQLALLLQVAVVAAGLGAILTTSEMAFGFIKWCGVAYLLYLGWKQWHAPITVIQPNQEAKTRTTAMALVLRGFLVNASNPKAIIFILAVLPQFINLQQPLLPQYLIMTLTMVCVDLVVMAGYTGLAARVLRLLQQPQHQAVMNKTFGGTFVAAALLLTSVKSS